MLGDRERIDINMGNVIQLLFFPEASQQVQAWPPARAGAPRVTVPLEQRLFGINSSELPPLAS